MREDCKQISLSEVETVEENNNMQASTAINRMGGKRCGLSNIYLCNLVKPQNHSSFLPLTGKR